ncbi:nucleoside phosphorylase domain-containing protein [Triangularia verruculosa]|uniref:Nucleoside phosphorylase domain-containing protein n=1 Tax=Triangularia verruculosa TaxID=2587418 RepID=A0AAN6XKG5_9PEZI|nr:nucleoside phosphorylase domain-containing protein [Triangularia verruculosa]
MNTVRPRCLVEWADFEIAVICALTLEADAVDALFDHYWDDDGPPYDKATGDPNAYSIGAVGRYNVVLAHMLGMGKANVAAVAANYRASFPNIKLALVVGVCSVVPFRPGGSGGTAETVLGDVIVSDGVAQYDLGRRLPEQFVPKDTLLDTLGRPNTEIRALLAKPKGLHVLQGEPELAATYPGTAQDKLFEATYRHMRDGMPCEECGCNGKLVPRTRLEQANGQPTVHFSLIASGNTVMKSGKDRDDIAREAGVVGFEMESAGVWDIFPCVVIKAACDYTESHKTKAWQRYAAATAAECRVPGYDDPKTDVLLLVKRWLERKDGGWWLMVVDNADDTQLFFGQQGGSEDGSAPSHEGNLGRYLAECSHGAILVTTRNKQTGSRLTKGKRPIEVGRMDDDETAQLIRARLDGVDAASGGSWIETTAK